MAERRGKGSQTISFFCLQRQFAVTRVLCAWLARQVNKRRLGKFTTNRVKLSMLSCLLGLRFGLPLPSESLAIGHYCYLYILSLQLWWQLLGTRRRKHGLDFGAFGVRFVKLRCDRLIWQKRRFIPNRRQLFLAREISKPCLRRHSFVESAFTELYLHKRARSLPEVLARLAMTVKQARIFLSFFHIDG